LLLIDAAVAWGEWSARCGNWQDAAVAFETAAMARRQLIGVQDTRAEKRIWVLRAAHISVAAAMAHRRRGDPMAVAVALDDGRALFLSERLEFTSTADRLRMAGRTDLADRLHAATGLAVRRR